MADPFLSDEQRHILRLVVFERQSLFFTGSAGTGKSMILRKMIQGLRNVYAKNPEVVAVTASTGLAAAHLGGQTLHSWAGAGLGQGTVKDIVARMPRAARLRWAAVKVLVIDEVSMIDGNFFDVLEQLACHLVPRARRSKPFGGIQLVVTGDFFQLPPISRPGATAVLAFLAQSWHRSVSNNFLLTRIFRQRDAKFASMLEELRRGQLSADTLQEFQRRSRPLVLPNGVEPTQLYPVRGMVDDANQTRLKQLKAPVVTYTAHDSGVESDPGKRGKLLDALIAPVRLDLKVGAQVLLTKNVDDELVNGSTGVVRAFLPEAFAAEDEDDGFGDSTWLLPAQTRVTSPATFGCQMKPGPIERLWPLVRFQVRDGGFRDILCAPEEWTSESPSGQVLARRRQVPLILAWALSIHKSQGMTLRAVKVDLRHAFEPAQTYVALSRACELAGLQVLNFRPDMVRADKRVVAFYDELPRLRPCGVAVNFSAQPSSEEVQPVPDNGDPAPEPSQVSLDEYPDAGDVELFVEAARQLCDRLSTPH